MSKTAIIASDGKSEANFLKMYIMVIAMQRRQLILHLNCVSVLEKKGC